MKMDKNLEVAKIIHKMLFEAANEYIGRTKGDTLPAAVIPYKMKNGELEMGPAQIYEDFGPEHKDGAARLLKSLPFAPGVLFAAFVSEIWMSLRTEEEIKAMEARGESIPMPSEDPKRVEAYMILINSRDTQYLARHPIDREKNELKWVEFDSGMGIGGRFSAE